MAFVEFCAGHDRSKCARTISGAGGCWFRRRDDCAISVNGSGKGSTPIGRKPSENHTSAQTQNALRISKMLMRDDACALCVCVSCFGVVP